MLLRRVTASLVIGALLSLAAFAAFRAWQPTTLTIAVAPNGGTEPTLIKAYAEALAANHKSLRLKIVTFDGVRQSAEALQARKTDLAIVRPDVFMPDNGLTLAILRDQAVLVVAPERSKIKAFGDLDRKRLGYLAERVADQTLIRDLVAHHAFNILTNPPTGALPPKSVALVPVEEQDLNKALAEKRIDAVVVVTTPTTPAAMRIVSIVRGASRDQKVNLFGIDDGAAILERFPRLQAMTIPAGLFGGNPKTPEEEVETVGATYRLMARSDMSRSHAAAITQYLFELRGSFAANAPSANYIHAPAYDTTAAATSARLPIHPGAIDYYEREQESFIERYETYIYLVALFGGGLGSAIAWIRQRLSRARREHAQVATDRLLAIQAEAGKTSDLARLTAMASEIDDLAAEIVRHAVDISTESRVISAAAMAVDAARSTVARAREAASGQPPAKPTLQAVG